jgi:hypothetical protein
MTMSLLLALLLSAPAQEPILRALPPITCTVASAERVTFAQLHRDLDRLRGRCIAVRGIWAGRALYDGEEASRAPDAEQGEANAANRVGLYGSVAIERGARWPDAYLAVGLLRDCASFWQGQDTVPGYCHNNAEGPFLIVTDLRRRHWPSIRGIW